MDYVALATQYARDVVEGRIVACKWVKLACQRQLSDLEALVGHPFYVWSPGHANHICQFIERLPHVKGPKATAGELIKLEPWQCFILTTVFGWKRADTKGRRFRRVYVEVPRGNAKSTLSSGVALYMMAKEGEAGADVYSAATTRDQAKIVWGDAYDMLKKKAAFARTHGIRIPRTKQTNGYITHPDSNSKFVPLSRESTNLDGLNVHGGIIDELHAHQTREIYDVIETGAAKRHSSLIWCITTAGSNTAGICYEVRGFTAKILEGVAKGTAADSQFGIIYTMDDSDDWTDPAVWKKANPNWGVSVEPEMFEANASKAMTILSAQNNFKTKHLCCWVNAAVAWMDLRAWDRCAEPDLDPEQFDLEQAYAGLDLATKTDIASYAKIFVRWKSKWSKACQDHTYKPQEGCRACYPDDSPAEAHYYLFVNNYLPEAAVEDGRNSQYEGWALEGWLRKTPGDVTDFALIRGDVEADLDRFRLRECAYDPWQTAQLAQELESKGLTTVEVRQQRSILSQPMKEFEALVLNGRLHHTGDPVLRWMVSNTLAHRDSKDNILPQKEAPQNKIDGVVAGIMALSRALTDIDPYASGGLKSL